MVTQLQISKHYKKDPATISRWKRTNPRIYDAMKYYYENVILKSVCKNSK